MTLVTSSRQALDSAFNDPTTTLLLLSDGDGGRARGMHDLAVEKVAAPWRRTFLVKELSILTASERAQWFNAPGRYAVLGGDPKTVALAGPLDDLCNQDGSPSIMRIFKVFSRGDQA